MKYSERILELLFPRNLMTIQELEKKYPKRLLSSSAIVTRFAPSPTGFMHIGGVYIASIAKNLANHSGGIYFVRIEDTDQKRKVEDSHLQFEKAFKYFNIGTEENDENSIWGPYTQSERIEVYLSCIKYLVREGKAYPCFCSKEFLDEKTSKQMDAKINIGYYGRWATCRNLSEIDIERRIKSGEAYVIRFRAQEKVRTVEFNDLIRGKLTMQDNVNDVVLLKSSSDVLPLPTYHLAHVVDDHFMRVNLVLRSDEWIPSVPIHIQLFDALGFDKIPYAHIAPLMKIDGKSKRKLSKRKDPEASVEYYMQNGYPSQAVIIYLKGLANSKLTYGSIEDCFAAPIKLNEFQKSGALIDLAKLKEISATYVSTMNAFQIRDAIANWAQEYDKNVFEKIKNNWEYTLQIIDADRFIDGKPRKDLFRWIDFWPLNSFFFSEQFDLVNSTNPGLTDYHNSDIRKLALEFIKHFKEPLNNVDWFSNIKDISALAGFAVDNKQYKENPDRYKGTIKETTHILRVAVTGKKVSPNLYDVFKILGKEEVIRRVSALLN